MSLLGPGQQTVLAGNQIQTLILGLYYMPSPQLQVPSNRVTGSSRWYFSFTFKTKALTSVLRKQEFNPSAEIIWASVAACP